VNTHHHLSVCTRQPWTSESCKTNARLIPSL
jgi:hypothetical protein